MAQLREKCLSLLSIRFRIMHNITCKYRYLKLNSSLIFTVCPEMTSCCNRGRRLEVNQLKKDVNE